MWMTLARRVVLVDTSGGMDLAGPETSARPRALLGGITLLIALTLSVRVLDAAYVVPAFRPMVAHAAVRLLASAGELEGHRPAERERSGRFHPVAVPRDPGEQCEGLPGGALAPLRCELLNLPPPAHARA